MGNCHGNHKSLLIGINYYGQGVNELSGCHNDVNNVKDLIMNKSFLDEEDNMRVLLDVEGGNDDPALEPTRENIINGTMQTINFLTSIITFCYDVI